MMLAHHLPKWAGDFPIAAPIMFGLHACAEACSSPCRVHGTFTAGM